MPNITITKLIQGPYLTEAYKWLSLTRLEYNDNDSVWFFKSDIKSYYESMDRAEVLRISKKHIRCSRILDLIEKFLVHVKYDNGFYITTHLEQKCVADRVHKYIDVVKTWGRGVLVRISCLTIDLLRTSADTSLNNIKDDFYDLFYFFSNHKINSLWSGGADFNDRWV